MSHVDRRDFIFHAAGGIAMAAALTSEPAQGQTDETPTLDIKNIPAFCAHEHWGSINSIGMSPEGFRADTEAGAIPTRRTGIWDLVLDPYLGGWIAATGFDVNTAAKQAGATDFDSWWNQDPYKAFQAVLPHLERQQSSGAFQCIRNGIFFLHGRDIGTLELEDWKRADVSIAAEYKSLFYWYQTVMTKASLSELIRPVHPVFYFRQSDSGLSGKELEFTHTIMRIDPLLNLWAKDSPVRDELAGKVGVDPTDASSWRDFLGRLFDLAQKDGGTGIKQAQAYSRSLRFDPQSDSKVTWRGDLTPEQTKIFEDWVVDECCKQAHERHWPHQIHVGTHNLRESSPLPLESLAKRYPQMKIVMLHCWPFINEAGNLAKHAANIYIDTCWQPVLNPRFLHDSLHTWLNYVPTHKIMCSQDSTSIEMAVGSSLFTREILAEALRTCCTRCVREESSLTRIAAGILNNNAVQVYGIGEEWTD